MRRFELTPFIIIGVFIAILVAGYKLSTLPVCGSWNYKVTVTVTTPEGDKSGSAVRQLASCARPSSFRFTSSVDSVRAKGEAVVVDLGERGLVFALLDTDEDIRFEKLFKGGSFFSPKGIKMYKESLVLGRSETLSPDRFPGYPIFVTFKDLDDPKTVTKLLDWKFYNPAQNGVNYELENDNFPEIFGEGVHLKSIEYEITDEPITWKVREKLSWLDNYFDKHFDGLKYQTVKSENPVANLFSSYSFSQKAHK